MDFNCAGEVEPTVSQFLRCKNVRTGNSASQVSVLGYFLCSTTLAVLDACLRRSIDPRPRGDPGRYCTALCVCLTTHGDTL